VTKRSPEKGILPHQGIQEGERASPLTAVRNRGFLQNVDKNFRSNVRATHGCFKLLGRLSSLVDAMGNEGRGAAEENRDHDG